MDIDSRYRCYFGRRGYLIDETSGQSKWFAAVWRYWNGERSVVAYWFADTEDEVYAKRQQSKCYKRCTVLFTPSRFC